jgi:methyl-accepting chemotaxis protein
MKNISVTTKGFAAFAILTLFSAAGSGLIYTKMIATDDLVQQDRTMIALVGKTGHIGSEVAQAELAVKSFLLTGDRNFLKTTLDVLSQLDRDLADLKSEYGSEAPDNLPKLQQAVDDIQEWRQTYIQQQIHLMRTPDTVDMARAIELNQDKAALVERFNKTVAILTADLKSRSDRASAEQQTALASVERISLLAAVLIALLASVLTVLNYRLVSRPLHRLALGTEALAGGDLDVEIGGAGGKDEIGWMSDAMQVFRAGALANKRLEIEADAARL